jgi:glutamyl-Q tRNA(Asp) synthetase
LLAAVGSYLDARASGARWRVRIEDLDTPRVVPGCADGQLRTLEAFGFEWDGDVLYQSSRREAYKAAIAELDAADRVFRCSCSRRDLMGDENDAHRYPGTCRQGPTKPGPVALRFRVSDGPIHFDDRLLGSRQFDLASLGDIVIARRDGLTTYQLAVVVDDAFQNVTHVVRGADLLDSTPWQIDLQAALGLPSPSYAHLPLLLDPDGRKLSKSRNAVPIDPASAPGALVSTLTYLSQTPPPDLALSSVEDVWKWAFANWNPQAMVGKQDVRLSARGDSEAEFARKIVGC